MNYVLPYVVSFMSLDFKDTNKFFGFLVFLSWLFLITFRSGQIILNPLLIVFGWNLYEIKYKYPRSPNIFTGRMLSRVAISPNTTYIQAPIQDVLIVKA